MGYASEFLTLLFPFASKPEDRNNLCMLQVIDSLLAIKSQAPSSASPSAPERQRIRVAVEDIRRLLHQVMGGGMAEEFAEGLNALAKNGDRIEQAIIVWFRLLDVLVQNAERRYGGQHSRGSIKKRELQAVMRRLLRSDQFDFNLPNVPDYLEPMIIDIAVSWTVDALVTVTNSYGLWDEEASHDRIATLWVWVRFLTAPIWIPITWLVSLLWKLRNAIRVRMPLSPSVRSAIEAVERRGILARKQELSRDAIDVVLWINEHSKSLIAMVELVFSVVQEAERFTQLNGADKKQYARDLILEILHEAGFDVRSGVFYFIIEVVINTMIEVAVDLSFNKSRISKSS